MAEQRRSPDTTIAIVGYALQLAGIATGGLTSLLGVVIAYVYRGGGPSWLDDHYRYQIRTFWLSLLYFSVSALLTLILIGFVTWLIAVVWLVIRCVKGIKGLQRQQAPANVTTWWL
ncbi:hypothetical protein GPM19_02480 [Halomonas sp. ZH2S]|uniref:DUF4870 domain-containing protein n=1 Tax=Vreelandella zhuhanensis TaxID=2684210 RepID=A0A7X3GYI8_9GAMM|nr:hypothetical protein [Halomonas zhuhanensis]